MGQSRTRCWSLPQLWHFKTFPSRPRGFPLRPFPFPEVLGRPLPRPFPPKKITSHCSSVIRATNAVTPLPVRRLRPPLPRPLPLRSLLTLRRTLRTGLLVNLLHLRFAFCNNQNRYAPCCSYVIPCTSDQSICCVPFDDTVSVSVPESKEASGEAVGSAFPQRATSG